MRLVIEEELTPARFGEIARPYRVFRDDVRCLVAVCSEIPRLAYSGRSFSQGQLHRHRLSLYDSCTFERKAVLSTQYPIHDVAFHALESKILIGTGSYDGGYMFEGDFFLYDWASDVLTTLLGETREVLACRFTKEGRIAAILSPRNDDEQFSGPHYVEGKNIYIGVEIDGPLPSAFSGPYVPDPRLMDLQPCDPTDFGFDISKLAKSWREKSPYGEADMSLFAQQGYQEHYGIWDLRWIDADHFAVALSDCHLEIWHRAGKRIHRFDGSGLSIELYPHQDGELIIHILDRVLGRSPVDQSQLWRWDGKGLEKIAGFDRAYAFSWNKSGQLLGLDCSFSGATQKHILLDGAARILAHPSCGGTDLMSARPLPSGLDSFFYLKVHGEKSWSNRDFRLWRITSSGEEQEIRTWNQFGRQSAYYSGFVLGRDRVVVAGSTWDTFTGQGCGSFLDIVSPLEGLLEASTKLDAPVACVISVLSKTAALVGHPSGGLTFVSLAGGEKVARQELIYDGQSVVPSTMIEQDGCIIIGTPEGRLLRGHLED